MNEAYPLPETLVRTILGVHQKQGELWLAGFRRLLTYCEQKWSFRVQLPSPYPLSFNFVAPVHFEDGGEAVLKLSVPSKEAWNEAYTLQLYQGPGMAKVLASEPEQGILLLERLAPGQSLKSVEDDREAVLIAAEVMRKLHRPAPISSALPTVAAWFRGLEKLRQRFQGGTGPIPEALVHKAEKLYEQLHNEAAASSVYLLHGDLHHDNILSSRREPWLAIDPKGVIGEAEYGVIPFLMNHLPEQQADRILASRIELFAQELGLSPRKILAWAFCHAILSAWWCIEDQSHGLEGSLRNAELYLALWEA